MHLAQKCSSFGVKTAGGQITGNKYIPLKVRANDETLIVRWYILEGVTLPHAWILSRTTLKNLGWIDVLLRIDAVNDDSSFANHSHVVVGYEGDAGPWTEHSYPLSSEVIPEVCAKYRPA